MGKATQIYRNGTILTMDSRGSVVSALAVEGSVVLAVGTDDDVMAHAGPDTVVTDLRGRTMLPGFVDGHSHSGRPLLSGESTGCKTMQDVATEKLGLDGMPPAPMRPIPIFWGGTRANWACCRRKRPSAR